MEEETQIRPIPGIAASPAPSVYSLEFKLTKLREFTQSGKSMKQFALENGIPDKTFWCWVEKAREGGMEGMFVYGSSWFERPMLIYDFSESRRTDATEDLLSGFSGTVICDSYKGYDRLKEKGIKLQRCWAHSRRRFYDIWKTLTEEEKAKSRCGPIIERFDAILSLERSWRESLVTPDEIKRRRNSEEYRGMLSGLESAATSFEPAKGSPLADAVAYFRNNWGDMVG